MWERVWASILPEGFKLCRHHHLYIFTAWSKHMRCGVTFLFFVNFFLNIYS